MNPDLEEISLLRKIFSVILGVAILGFGFYFGVLPIFQIASSLLRGEQQHGYFGIFVLSVPMIPLGIWVIFLVLKPKEP